jgi:ADP-dependent NAD(P)H-hydrate dehydratase
MSPSSRGELLNARFLRRWPLPPIDPAGGKDSRGAVLIVGGSPQMPGAVLLAATAALRAGAGKLQVATGKSVAAFVAAQIPEALVIGLPETRAGGLSPACSRELAKRAAGMTAVLIGPGMIDTSAAGRLGVELCGRLKDVTLVLDAEALECCSLEPRAVARSAARVAITPHAKEMAHALGLSPPEVQRDPEKAALRAAAELKAAVALKGATTYLADPAGRLIRNQQAGNPGLGTSGTGDVLSGILAGLAARGADPLQAAAWAVYVHGRAADVLARKIGPIGYLARELLAEIPRQLAKLSPNER